MSGGGGDPIWVLKTMAQARLVSSIEVPTASAVKAALLEIFARQVPGPEPVSEAELAQAALDVLAEDAAFHEPVKTMLRQPVGGRQGQKYIEPATIATLTAVLLVLQFRCKAKFDSSGKWSVELEKQAASDGALKLLMQRLLLFLDK